MKKKKNIENLDKMKEENSESTQILSDAEEKNESKEEKKKEDNGTIDLQNKNEELQNKINELNDKYLRLYSEFDNYRKRTLKEKIELNKTASMDVILTLLPVMDDFDRAVKTIEITEGVNAFNEGVLLIFNKLKKTLNQLGVEEMKTIGEVFNTDLHEAITNIPATTEDLKGKVVDEIQKGYVLNGKVIRYAKVVVGN